MQLCWKKQPTKGISTLQVIYIISLLYNQDVNGVIQDSWHRSRPENCNKDGHFEVVWISVIQTPGETAPGLGWPWGHRHHKQDSMKFPHEKLPALNQNGKVNSTIFFR